jgi:hypothetical protein
MRHLREEMTVMGKYFVTVYARTGDDMRRLQPLGLDLFPQTATRSADDTSHPCQIDGLLSIDEIEQLVAGGYQVRLQDTVEARSHHGAPMEFDAWLAGMQPTLAEDRNVR